MLHTLCYPSFIARVGCSQLSKISNIFQMGTQAAWGRNIKFFFWKGHEWIAAWWLGHCDPKLYQCIDVCQIVQLYHFVSNGITNFVTTRLCALQLYGCKRLCALQLWHVVRLAIAASFPFPLSSQVLSYVKKIEGQLKQEGKREPSSPYFSSKACKYPVNWSGQLEVACKCECATILGRQLNIFLLPTPTLLGGLLIFTELAAVLVTR